jgi:hypothetical protein
LASSGRLAYEDQDQKQIKSFPAEAGPTDGCAGFYWLNALLLVGPALAGKRPVWAMGLFELTPGRSIVPTLRVGMHPLTLRVIWLREHIGNSSRPYSTFVN